MAMPLSRTLACLHRATCRSLTLAEASLDLRHPLPLLVQVRTKKRTFIPPPTKVTRNKKQMDTQTKARRAGIVLQQETMERPINIACTAGVFDPYIPPEGDARLSSLSKEGLKQRSEQIRQSTATLLAIRKIKEHCEFVTKEFAEEAQQIFIEAHNALSPFDRVKLHSLVTERCYPEMTKGIRYKTVRWTFNESLEPPRVVHARCPDMVNKDNLYGQVTVRMHSKQTLAIYDRFGRLMLGSEEQPKDVLEYLVIERQLLNAYGRWRLHAKIIPSWAPAKDPIVKTVIIPGPELKPWEEFDPSTYEVPKPEAVQWNK